MSALPGCFFRGLVVWRLAVEAASTTSLVQKAPRAHLPHRGKAEAGEGFICIWPQAEEVRSGRRQKVTLPRGSKKHIDWEADMRRRGCLGRTWRVRMGRTQALLLFSPYTIFLQCFVRSTWPFIYLLKLLPLSSWLSRVWG